MKKLLLFVLAAMAFVACTQNDVEELTANRNELPETLTVGFEGGDTRIELNEALKTVWTEGDEVSVFYQSYDNTRWGFQGATGDRSGELTLVSGDAGAQTMDNSIVVYPYSDSYAIDADTHAVAASLPAVQSYKEDSYGAESNIMVAESEFTQFSLKSVCGWLRVELTGKRHIVNSITLRGNAGEQVAGLIYVDTATAEATLASEMGAASDEDEMGGVGGGLEFDDTIFREVTLDCGSGVMLGAEATAFYIALLPQTFEKGVTIEVDYANAEPQTLVCDSSITIRRNHISPIESEANVEVEIPTNKLWYTATAKVKPYGASAFNVAIASNEWNEATGEGVITFDGELTTIGNHAFYWCHSLTRVTIPDSVTTIGDSAFSDCYSLTSVTIGDSVTTIGWGAFYNCTSLTSVTIPDSVTTIGEYAFWGCSSLTSVYITDIAAWCNISFEGNYLSDGADLYLNNELVTELTIPDSVTTIGRYAFHYCSSLTSVTIGDSVTTIGDEAFAYCYSLTSVYCKPITTPALGSNAFFNAHNYGAVNIGCAIYVPAESVEEYKVAENWSEYADHIVEYDYSSTMTISYTTSDGMPANANGLIVSNSSQNGVGELIYIGKDIIPAGLFLNCHNLTFVTIPDNVTTIGDWAFYNCSSLTSVTIGDSVTTIGYAAFNGCSSLTSVTIPDSVTTIGMYAFYGCSSLTSVYCEATTPPTLGNYVFWGYDNNWNHVMLDCDIYVPAESVEAYEAASGWSDYAADIVGYDFE